MSESKGETNIEFAFVKPLEGAPKEDNFAVRDSAMPELKDGEFKFRTRVLSVDPYLVGRMHQKTFLGQPVCNFCVAEVVESKNPKFRVGDYVTSVAPMVRFGVSDGLSNTMSPWHAFKNELKLPLTYYVGVLGMPGITAYGGMVKSGAVKQGDIVLVSGAAGAVGSLAGQIARLRGAKLVIGTAGGKDKCELVVKKFKFDHCIDYKQFTTAEAVEAELKRLSPEGIDLYFDNVGGHVTASIWDVLRSNARVLICGAIADYNSKTPSPMPNFLSKLIYRTIEVKGILSRNYYADFALYAEFEKTVSEWVSQEKLVVEETVSEGFGSVASSFMGLFSGANVGKMVIKV